MEVKPLKKMVLIGEQKREQTTAAGIIIEGTRGTGDMAKATVIAVGPEVTEVKVGDIVLPEWGKSSPVTIDGVQRAMIKEEFIIAVFE